VVEIVVVMVVEETVVAVEIKINTKEDLFDAVQGAILGRRQYRLRSSVSDILLNGLDENIRLTKYLLDNRNMHPDSRHEMEKVLIKLENMKTGFIELKKLHDGLKLQ